MVGLLLALSLASQPLFAHGRQGALDRCLQALSALRPQVAVRLHGAAMARSSAAFSYEALSRVRVMSQELMRDGFDPEGLRPEILGSAAASRRINSLVLLIAEASGLAAYLKSPLALHVRIVSMKTNEVSVQAGHMFLTPELFLRLENDDELAAVLGHEMLHHVLGHSLAVAQLEQAFQAERGMSIAEAAAVRLSAYEALELFQETEVDMALPFVLQRAGFDAWAEPALRRRFQLMDPRSTNRADAMELYLRLRGISPKGSRRSTAILDEVRSLLPPAE